MIVTCYKCGEVTSKDRKIWHLEVCENCNSYLHVCLNCKFYDPQASKQCREPEADKIADKDKSNYCEYFEPGKNKSVGKQERAEDAKKKLDDLFKNLKE